MKILNCCLLLFLISCVPQQKPCGMDEGDVQPCASNGSTWEDEDQKSCFFEHGSGILEDNMCKNITCHKGYELKDNTCVSVNLEKDCVVENGRGKQVSSDNGKSFGLCKLIVCDSGFMLNNNVCVSSYVKEDCRHMDYSVYKAYRESFDNGKTFSSCKAETCQSGFKKQNDICVEDVSIITDYAFYETKFRELARKYNISLGPVIIKTAPITTLGVLGICTNNSGFSTVLLKESWWNSPSINNTRREIVMFHELGHCLLKRDHLSIKTNTENPNYLAATSIMHPSMLEKSLYLKNYEHYMNELFTRDILTSVLNVY